MFRVVAAALVAVFLCLPSVANSAECADMDVVVAQLSAHNAPLHQFTAGEMPQVLGALKAVSDRKLVGATRAFIFATSSGVQIGVEIDGCLIDPILIAPPRPRRLSGKSPDGRIGA